MANNSQYSGGPGPVGFLFDVCSTSVWDSPSPSLYSETDLYQVLAVSLMWVFSILIVFFGSLCSARLNPITFTLSFFFVYTIILLLLYIHLL